MSKPSRRRQQPGSQPSAGRPAGARPPGQPSSSGSTTASRRATRRQSGDPSARPAGASVPGARAGRRERARITYERSFLERYRGAIVAVAAIAGVGPHRDLRVRLGVRAGVRLLDRVDPAADGVARPPARRPPLGYVQDDMGRKHVATGDKVTYTYCPPASGSHYNASGAGADPAAPVRPERQRRPRGLDPQPRARRHGHPVSRRTGTGAHERRPGGAPGALRRVPDQPRLRHRAGHDPGTGHRPVRRHGDAVRGPRLGPRPAAPDARHRAQILAFWQQWGEQTNPEPQCAPPTPPPSAAPERAPERRSRAPRP